MADLMQDGPQRNRVRYILALALMVGILLAGYLAFNVWDRVRALGSAQQDHAEWVFSQLEIDFLKLDGAVEQARSGDENDLANLRKRFDIFYSRTEVAERVQQSVDLSREIQKIQAVLDTQIPLIDGSDEGLAAGVPALSEALATVEDMPRNIGLASISFAAKAAEAERKEIAQLIEILLVIVVTVTIALLGAILRLSRQTITLNRASREVERNHSQLATMLRASLDAVMVLSVDGEIIDFNGSAEEVFSISRDHALGRSYIELLVPPKLRHRQRDNLAHFNATGKTRLAETGRHETEMIDGTGRIFPVELSVSLARSNDAPVFVTYIRDITDKLQKEQEIIRARDEALDAYQEKSRFFAMMSHEMRTPLNGILSAIHLLHDDKLDAEQRKYVEAALKSGDILLGHIDDVLAIERSEAETNDNELQASDMVALTAGMVNTMTPLAKTSDTRLHLDQDGLTDTPILTDPRAVQQILVNLISNAIKFSPDDDIVLSATYDMETDNAPMLHIEVADNGPGIPPDDLKRIFEDYVSLDSRYERRTGGTGLGLGIVRRLVHRLGGTITCVSEVGKGARFIVRLPADFVQTEAPQPVAQPQLDTEDTPAMNLLVVDDNEINRDLLKAMLGRLGHEVTLASSGPEGIDRAAEQRFDAILMDISMPGMSGLQATQVILQGGGPNANTPIMAVTAHALPNERAAFTAGGMTGFLQKPINTRRLKTALSELVMPAADGASDAAEATQAEPQHPVLNANQVNELFELLGPEKLADRIGNLRQRVEGQLPPLASAEDRDDLQRKTHDLAGLCGMFGAERMHALLATIEQDCKQGDVDKARDQVAKVPAAWAETLDAWEARLSA